MIGESRACMGTMYGYTRVSTGEQNEALQRDALLEYGVFEQDIFAETISGAIAPDQRPKLSQLLEKLSPQDKLVVWKLDRLGRSALDMLQLDRTLQERQVKLISITEGLDTHTPIGKFYYAILASLAQMERETIRQRVEAGLQAAKLRGKTLGRPKKLRPDVIRQIQILKQAGESVNGIVSSLNLGRTTVYRGLKIHLPDLGGNPHEQNC